MLRNICHVCDVIGYWLSGLMCRIQLHSWDYGPGECCSQCGVADAFFEDARPGRAAKHTVTGRVRYFPERQTVPDGWVVVTQESKDV